MSEKKDHIFYTQQHFDRVLVVTLQGKVWAVKMGPDNIPVVELEFDGAKE